MSELAFNVNGERFDVPDEAEFWRVRRFKPSGRGTPEVVFDGDGLPLVIAIDTDIHEFRRLVEMQPGRYRLDPIDADQKACEDGTAAYVQLAEASSAPSSAGVEVAGGSSRHDDLIRDLVRVNAEMVKSITEKFATVMDSAATLIRAADGAGMPARQPVPVPLVEDGELEDDDEEEEHRNAGGFDLGSFLAQMMPMFQMVMAQRNQANGSAAQTRNAAADVDEDDDDDYDDEVEGDDDAGDEPAPAAAAVKPPGPEAMAHFAAIQSRLTPEEAQLAQAVASELPPAEINGWIAELSKLSVDDAVALIRETIRKSRASAGDGGAS